MKKKKITPEEYKLLLDRILEIDRELAKRKESLFPEKIAQAKINLRKAGLIPYEDESQPQKD